MRGFYGGKDMRANKEKYIDFIGERWEPLDFVTEMLLDSDNGFRGWGIRTVVSKIVDSVYERNGVAKDWWWTDEEYVEMLRQKYPAESTDTFDMANEISDFILGNLSHISWSIGYLKCTLF